MDIAISFEEAGLCIHRNIVIPAEVIVSFMTHDRFLMPQQRCLITVLRVCRKNEEFAGLDT